MTPFLRAHQAVAIAYLLVLYHPVLVSGRMELSSSACHGCMQHARSLGSSFNDLLKTCLPLKLFLTTSPCLFLDSRITPAAQLGLVPYQNHIKPIYDPYMGHPHSKNWTLDFSLRFDFLLRPRSIFPTPQRFPLPNHVTSGDVTSGHVTSGCLSPRFFFTPGQRF